MNNPLARLASPTAWPAITPKRRRAASRSKRSPRSSPGGDSGPGVVPGKPAESILLARAAHRDADADTMPPQGNSVDARSLAPNELELLERWIAEGAAAGSAATTRPIDWRPLAAGTNAVVCVDMTVDGRLTAAARGSRVSLFDTISGTPQGDLIDGAVRYAGSVCTQAHRDPNRCPGLLTGWYHERDRIVPRDQALEEDGSVNRRAGGHGGGDCHRGLTRRGTHRLRHARRQGGGRRCNVRQIDSRSDDPRSTDGGLRDTYEAARPAGAGPPVMLSWTDGRLLASGSGRASRNGEIKLWNMENGMLSRALPQPHADTIMTLAFSSRGNLLASGSTDRFVKVHTVTDGKPVRSFEGHAGHVLAVSWQANGQRLASAGADHSLRIWDMARVRRGCHGGDPPIKVYSPNPATSRAIRRPGAVIASASRAATFTRRWPVAGLVRRGTICSRTVHSIRWWVTV